MSVSAPYVLLDDQVSHRCLFFSNPSQIITYRSGDPPEAFLREIDRLSAQGHWIAGQLDYEFGLMLEPRLMGRVAPGQILARLGVFDAPAAHPPVEMLYRSAPPELALKPRWSERDYLTRFETVQDYLRAGDVYQINLTFPMIGDTDGSAADLYAGFRRRQPGRYGGVVSLGDGADDPVEIISFSPELFFARDGRSFRMRPMKGTRPKTATDDMRIDEKSQAENLMIVDLLRNDLSRLCEPGSVKVPELFAIEDYPTLIQMTSQVTGTLRQAVGWSDIFPALFPCGSVTGAPKIRAMEIINELEAGPRGPYCGTVGYIAPSGQAAFSVAIRTAVLKGESVRYDVGSGVVLDSDGPDEYRECLLKSDILRAVPETQFETLRATSEGPVRADRHARRFGQALPQFERTERDQRIRVDKWPEGAITVNASDVPTLAEPVKIAVSRYPLTEAVQRTDIKTSRRNFYEGERERLAAEFGINEALFTDEDGFLKEGSFTSLFITADGQMKTPRGPGLLPGILREELLETGQCVEAELRISDLLAADEIWVGNSLRGLLRAELTVIEPAPRHE